MGWCWIIPPIASPPHLSLPFDLYRGVIISDFAAERRPLTNGMIAHQPNETYRDLTSVLLLERSKKTEQFAEMRRLWVEQAPVLFHFWFNLFFHFSLGERFTFLTKIENEGFTNASQWLLLRGLQRINVYFTVMPDFKWVLLRCRL